MFRGSFYLPLLGLLLVSCFSVGCLNKKSDEVAVEAAAPPPAAYPSSPEGYADSSTAPVSPATSSPAPSAPQPPVFELREGETLVTYKIELGDSLSKIAGKYNTSITRIKAANGMTSDKIYAGKTLRVPTAAPPGLAMNTPSTPSPTGSAGASGSYYGRSGSAAPSTSPNLYGAPASAPSQSPYPSTTAPAPPIPTTPSTTSPSSTSYPRVASPPIPPQPQQPAGSFPTPNLGTGTGIQFSE